MSEGHYDKTAEERIAESELSTILRKRREWSETVNAAGIRDEISDEGKVKVARERGEILALARICDGMRMTIKERQQVRRAARAEGVEVPEGYEEL